MGARPGRIELKADARATNAPQLKGEFSEKTREWFEGWRQAPQATLFEPIDWRRLILLATVVERFFEAPTAALMAEIRASESLLGATPGDRIRLGWHIEGVDDASEPAKEKPKRPDPRKAATK